MATFENQIIINAQTNLKRVSKDIEKAFKKISRSGEKTTRSLKKMSAATKKLGQDMKSVGQKAALSMTLPIAAVGVSMIKAASDADEVASKFKVVFGDVDKQAQNVAENLAKNYGLAESSAKKLLSSSGDLLTGFGFTDKAALDLSKRISELSVDVASFSNVEGGAERVVGALNSALTGEREALKSLGIVINEDLIKRELQRRGLQNLQGAALRAAKANITLDEAYKQSEKAIGDFSNTQHLAANQFRILAERNKELREELGKKLLPIATEITSKLITLIERFRNLSEEQKDNILKFAGIAAAIGPVLIILGTVISTLGSLSITFLATVTAIKTVIAVIAALKVALLAIPGLGIVAGIAMIASAIYMLVDDWGAVGEWIKKYWNNTVQFMANILNFLLDAFAMPDLLPTITKAWQPVRDFFNGLWDGIIQTFESGVGKVTSVIDSVKGKVNAVKDFFSFGDSPELKATQNVTAAAAKIPAPATVTNKVEQRSELEVKIKANADVTEVKSKSDTGTNINALVSKTSPIGSF